MIKQLLGWALAIAYITGIFKAFSSGFIVGVISIFVPPVAIYMLFT